MKIRLIDFESITLRQDVSHRGGGVEIDLGKIYAKYKGHKMAAYQNYLGGGMLGRVMGDCTLKGTNDPKLDEIMLRLKEYFHSLTNHSDDEFENQSFEVNQTMPISAY